MRYLVLFFSLLISCTSFQAKEQFDISQVNFSTTICEGNCPVFTLKIQQNGSATYKAETDNEREGLFYTTIKKAQLDSLLSLISSANIFKLKNEYSASYTDHPTYTLAIQLKDGRTKLISDYGPNGPQELKNIYSFLFSLRESQEWKPQ